MVNENGDNVVEKLTPFEIQLKQFFPEIFELHVLGKEVSKGGGGEEYIWDLVKQILEMNRTCSTGIIFVNFNRGRIDNISVKQDILKYRSQKVRNAMKEDND